MTDDTEWRAEKMPVVGEKWNRWRVAYFKDSRWRVLVNDLDEPTARLIAAAKDMQKALEFYAAGGMWQWDIAPDPAGTPIPNSSPVECDRGQIARAALAKSRLQT
jgi:hypothetical protein